MTSEVLLTPILLTPGPTFIPQQVFAAMSQSAMHHRSENFKLHFRKALNNLKGLLKTASDPLLIAGSGTASMEAALLNLAAPGDKVLVINSGKFGERWTLIAKQLGLDAYELRVQWGLAATAAELSEFVSRHADAKLLCLQQCETSTGTQHAVRELCSAAKQANPNLLTVVDAVSSVATTPLYPQSDSVDVVAGAVHKGLMTPPGLSFIWLSDSAWTIAEATKVRSLYFNLLVERKAHAKDTSAWTPAMNHILGLNAAFELINAEGLDKVFERHIRLSRACIAAAGALGLELYSTSPAAGVTALVVPKNLDAEKVRSVMLNKYNVRIAGGQDELKGRILRIGHMGHVSLADLSRAVEALHGALKECGVDTVLQKALQALEEGYRG